MIIFIAAGIYKVQKLHSTNILIGIEGRKISIHHATKSGFQRILNQLTLYREFQHRGQHAKRKKRGEGREGGDKTHKLVAICIVPA